MSRVLVLRPDQLSRRQVTSLANGLVAPRPVAWVSSSAPDGTANLAPFSFFNCFSTAPFTVGIGPGSREGVHKDSLSNIKASGEFTISMVNEALAVRANRSNADLDPAVDEWRIAAVTPRPSVTVAPPSVAESPAALECRVVAIIDLGAPERPTNSLIVARVTCIHILEEAVSGDHYEVIPDAVGLVGRMGGDLWSTTRERFSLARPTADEAKVMAREGTVPLRLVEEE